MPPAFATAAPVYRVSNVNGMAARPQSYVRSACCCTASCRSCSTALALLPLQRPPVRLYVAHPTAAPPGLPVATYHRFAARSIRDPIARLTCTISSLVARTACSQCSRCHSRASHDLAVWCLRHLRDPVQISIGITRS